MRRKLLLTAQSIAGQAADDALQEAFCRLWTLQKIPDDDSQVERLAMTTVKHISIDYQRRSARHPEASLTGMERKPGLEVELSGRADKGDEQERFDIVKGIIEQRLSETQRKALWMRDYEDYSFADIAEELDTTEANVRKIISRARKQVREIYRASE